MYAALNKRTDNLISDRRSSTQKTTLSQNKIKRPMQMEMNRTTSVPKYKHLLIFADYV